MGSATPRFGMEEDGLSRLPGGRYLRDALEADPERWLGPAHAKYFGSSPALLVKLLDAGQRLPVHVHPDRSFAYRHLGSRHGKTEAWVVLGVRGASPTVYLGWSRDMEAAELSRWVADQDTAIDARTAARADGQARRRVCSCQRVRRTLSAREFSPPSCKNPLTSR